MAVAKSGSNVLRIAGGGGVISVSDDDPPPGGAEYAGLTPDLYAGPTALGSGNGSSEANCMALNTALANATAGDIVGLLPGSTSSYIGNDENDRKIPTHNPANSGTAGNLITFVAKYPAAYLGGDLADLITDRATYVAAIFANSNRTQLSNGVDEWPTTPGNSGGCPVFGAYQRDYIRWIGVCVDGEDSFPHADTGHAGWWQSDGGEMHQCVIKGRGQDYDDNYNALRLEDLDGFVGKNCILYDIAHPTNPGHNTASMMLYSAQNVDIRNFDAFDNDCTLFVKGNSAGSGNSSLFKFCRFHHGDNGLLLLETTTGENLVEQCLIYEQFTCAVWDDSVTGASVRNNKFRNCTLVTRTSGSYGGAQGAAYITNLATGTGHVLDDCLLVARDSSGDRLIEAGEFSGAALFSSKDSNHYYARGGTLRWSWNGVNYTTRASFETAAGFTNGTEGDPDFDDEASFDYHLGGSTTATGKGAYITGSEEIGLQASPTL